MRIYIYAIMLTSIRLIQCDIFENTKISRKIPMASRSLKRKIPLKLSSIYTSSPSTKTYYNPNPGYDAYWTDGHWIFGTTTTKAYDTSSTRSRVLVCRKPCGIEFRYLGETCGHRVDFIEEWSIGHNVYTDRRPQQDTSFKHFKTFPTYCHFLAAQCNDKIWNNMSWVFIHFGTCLQDDVALLPLDTDQMVLDRKIEVLKTYNVTIHNETSPIYHGKCGVTNRPEQTHKWVDRVDVIGSCYLFRMDRTYHYTEARDLCKSYGADLIVYDNEVERDIVTELMNEHDPSLTFYTDFTKQYLSFYRLNKWGLIPMYKEYIDSLSWLFITSHRETLHEIGYQPWTHNRSNLDIAPGVYTCIVITAGDSRYNARKLDIPYWELHLLAYPLCEKRVAPLVN